MIVRPVQLGLWLLLSLAMACQLQAAEPTTKPLRMGQLSASKVLFLGNSITLHGPAEKIGWLGNWGMAASRQDLDYVHLLLGKLRKATQGEPQVLIQNIADFERQHATYNIDKELQKALDFQADIVIVAIGENVPALSSPELQQQYEKAFQALLTKLHARGEPIIFVRSTFWTDKVKDKIMAAACQPVGATWIDLGGLDKDEKHFARSERKIEHAGVGHHPGDAGMQAIADVIWQAIEQRSRTKT